MHLDLLSIPQSGGKNVGSRNGWISALFLCNHILLDSSHQAKYRFYKAGDQVLLSDNYQANLTYYLYSEIFGANSS